MICTLSLLLLIVFEEITIKPNEETETLTRSSKSWRILFSRNAIYFSRTRTRISFFFQKSVIIISCILSLKQPPFRIFILLLQICPQRRGLQELSCKLQQNYQAGRLRDDPSDVSKRLLPVQQERDAASEMDVPGESG